MYDVTRHEELWESHFTKVPFETRCDICFDVFTDTLVWHNGCDCQMYCANCDTELIITCPHGESGNVDDCHSIYDWSDDG